MTMTLVFRLHPAVSLAHAPLGKLCQLKEWMDEDSIDTGAEV